MYSPEIDSGLIPVLYRTAKSRKVPMTRLVDELLFKALSVEPMPEEALLRFQPYKIAPVILPEELMVPNVYAFRFRQEVDAWHQTSLNGLRRAAQLYHKEHGFYTLPQAECAKLLSAVRDQAVSRIESVSKQAVGA